MLRNLLAQLKGHDIIVWDDNSNFTIESDDLKFHRFKKNHGKKYAWEKFDFIFNELRKTNYDYYFMLPDDVELEEDFIDRSIELWNSIDDNKKACLSFSTKKRITKPCFTFVEPKYFNRFVKTGWTDLAFICGKEFFKEVDIKEIPLSRWEENELLGSGVGSQISWQLLDKGFNMYHSREELLKHLGVESKMNPEERKINPI
jgi:hypothetical protein